MDMLTGKQIREIRQGLGLNITAFAYKFGVTEGAVRRWEKETCHPRWDTMVELNRLRRLQEARDGKDLQPA